MVQVKDLIELTLRDLWQEVKGEDDWREDLKGQTKRLVKRLLESSMDEEILEELRVNRYRRSHLRRGYRNGYRHRSLLAEFGQRYAARARELAEKEEDATRKAELLRIAEICDWVPANPARTFYEALQSYHFAWLMLTLDLYHNIAFALGKIDQYSLFLVEFLGRSRRVPPCS